MDGKVLFETPFDVFPNEILGMILRKIPLKYMIVCSRWHCIISNSAYMRRIRSFGDELLQGLYMINDDYKRIGAYIFKKKERILECKIDKIIHEARPRIGDLHTKANIHFNSIYASVCAQNGYDVMFNITVGYSNGVSVWLSSLISLKGYSVELKLDKLKLNPEHILSQLSGKTNKDFANLIMRIVNMIVD